MGPGLLKLASLLNKMGLVPGQVQVWKQKSPVAIAVSYSVHSHLQSLEIVKQLEMFFKQCKCFLRIEGGDFTVLVTF